MNVVKPKKNKVVKTVSLAQLNAELSSINDEFLTKYNSLREKYKFSEPPDGSQDKYELDKLQAQYERKRAENFALSKDVNKNKIGEVVGELVQLKVDYEQLRATNNQPGLARIRRQYELKRDEYSGLTGEEYEELALNVEEPNIPKLKSLSTQNSLKAKQAQNELKLLGLEDKEYDPSNDAFHGDPGSPLYQPTKLGEVTNADPNSPGYHPTDWSTAEIVPSEVKVVKLDK